MNLEIEQARDGYVIRLTQPQMVQLGLAVGDFLEASVLKDGRARLVLDRRMTKTMRIARDVMLEYRETFEKLAKS